MKNENVKTCNVKEFTKRGKGKDGRGGRRQGEEKWKRIKQNKWKDNGDDNKNKKMLQEIDVQREEEKKEEKKNKKQSCILKGMIIIDKGGIT